MCAVAADMQTKHWAGGLTITTSGLSADERQLLQAIIEAAGGRRVADTFHTVRADTGARLLSLNRAGANLFFSLQVLPSSQPALHAPASAPARRRAFTEISAGTRQRGGRALGHVHRKASMAHSQRVRRPARARGRLCSASKRRPCHAAAMYPGDPLTVL